MKTGILAKVGGVAIAPIALGPRHLVWEAGAIEGNDTSTVLVQRDLRSGRTTTLARNVARAFGLAATSDWVVYATGRLGTTIMAVRHDGSDRRILAASAIAPISSRGDLVAWAEGDTSRQRVVVRDMASGKEWTAAEMPACVEGRCYRIDAVALADRGIVFSRGAIGPHPSFVVRRGFADSEPTELKVPNDPQPDLVPSSAGALYYVLSRAWYRWDFGDIRPRLARLPATAAISLIRREGNHWFLHTRKECRSGLLVDDGRGRRIAVASADQVLAFASSRRQHGSSHGQDVCVLLDQVMWAGSQPVSAWTLASEESEEEHSNEGTVGIVLAGKPLP
ncbi:MAG: hypothetical protein AABM30_13530 [Actinomycetota bacterium]